MYVGIHYNIHVPMRYEVGGIRNQASESIDFLGYRGPCIFFILLEGFLFVSFLLFDFLALFFARMTTKSERERERGKEKER